MKFGQSGSPGPFRAFRSDQQCIFLQHSTFLHFFRSMRHPDLIYFGDRRILWPPPVYMHLGQAPTPAEVLPLGIVFTRLVGMAS
ncbi:hypothetical protein E2C01_042096 [Portunus trituberculatus]|uniref:Uncharacterized protein n=1 Tax=Portunus trituberculatus TaxID=210409 RepID=A0A5B7FTN0_PORTR|nr:hypothetical protein [Portunus trituberculatus]